MRTRFCVNDVAAVAVLIACIAVLVAVIDRH